MPMVIPLIAAGFEAYAGVAAIAAAETTAGAFVGGLMVAGGALTAMGTLMQDKSLTRLGMFVGLAGGIGNLAGVGQVTTAATEVGKEVSTAAPALGETPVAPTPPADAGVAASQMPATPVDTALSTQAPAFQSSGDLAKMAANSPTSAFAQPSGVVQSAMNPAAMESMMGTPGYGANAAADLAGGAGTSGAGAGATFANSTTGQSTMSFWQKLQGYGKTAADAIKQNKELAQVGGGLLYGGMQGYNATQQREAMQDYDQLKRNQYNASIYPVHVPVYRPPVPTATPTTGA